MKKTKNQKDPDKFTSVVVSSSMDDSSTLLPTMYRNTQTTTIVFANPESATKILRTNARAALAYEKERVLASLPDAFQHQWKHWHDLDGRKVYVLSPYDVSPGPERTMWMDAYARVRHTSGGGMSGAEEKGWLA